MLPLPSITAPRPKVFERHGGPTSGFTLVELLIAIGLVAILAVLIFPVFRNFRERSQGVVCANNMRQLAAALMAYHGEHNGWFPPGYPLRINKIDPANKQPDAPPQGGASNLNFQSSLVPNYIGALPLCPSHRLTPAGRAQFAGKEMAKLRSYGGSYGVNAILLQWKIISMPQPSWPATAPYSAAKIPFLLETGCGSATWSMVHQNQAVNGVSGYPIAGRNHGGEDGLNFMFLDGHMELIRRNDLRDVPEDQKSWIYPTNPNGRFAAWGAGNRYVPVMGMSDGPFDNAYPGYGPAN